MKEFSRANPQILIRGEAEGLIAPEGAKNKPITVIGTEAIRSTFDAGCIQQAINTRLAPGVTDLVLNPDAHVGYGAPVGCALASPTHIYPGPVGVDIKCSMSLLQLDLPESEIRDRRTRRAVIDAILQRTPTGAGKGQRSVKKSRRVSPAVGTEAAVHGASPEVCAALGIPYAWAGRCEDANHVGLSGDSNELAERLEMLIDTGQFRNFEDKIAQLGSYGGGNHFGECNVVELEDSKPMRGVADVFGLRDGAVTFLSHCGSRGFGYTLASGQFKTLREKFEKWGLPLPGNDRELVYAPLDTPEAADYLADMSLGGNFATVNHLLINALVLEAFQEIFPGVKGDLVYFISHNIARKETLGGVETWVHRKGATRAYPGGHPSLAGTIFAETGHPILLPGNPRDGSVVMVAEAGAEKSLYSVNHGAGRRMGRKAAKRELDQRKVDAEFDRVDILSNCRNYPLDEAPNAYKDFAEVVKSVETAGLASTVARLRARFVIKDSDKQYGGAA